MTRKSALVAIASVLFVVLVATAFLAAHAKRRSEALLAVVMAKQAALQVEIRETKQTIAELERRRAELSDAAAHIAARHASPAPSNPQTQQRPKPPSFLDLGRAYPELMDLFALSKRAELGQQYGPFFQALKLSPGQIEAFKDLRAERTARSGDIALAANELGIDPLDPIAAAVRQKEDEQINKPREIALLGEEGWRALQEYERSLRARGMAHGLAAAVAFSDPLTAAQANRLTQIVAEADASYRAGSYANLKDVDWTAVDRQARAILTSRQFAVWQRGATHDPVGGSRLRLQLEQLYEQVTKGNKDADSGEAPD